MGKKNCGPQEVIKVNASIDAGIVSTVRILNALPFIRTYLACQGEGGGPASVNVTPTCEAEEMKFLEFYGDLLQVLALKNYSGYYQVVIGISKGLYYFELKFDRAIQTEMNKTLLMVVAKTLGNSMEN